MFAVIRRIVTAVCVLLLAACHSQLPPIEGRYVTPDGQDTVLKDGQFVGAMVGQGVYIVDGQHLTLRLSVGPRLEGERLDENHFRIDHRDGQAIRPADFYREGSPGAEAGKQALAIRLGHPVVTDAQRDAQAAAQQKAEVAAAFVPDQNTPLERFAPLDTAEDAAVVEAAFAAPPLTDEQLLAALVPGYAKESDSFKRRDLAAGLPALKAKVEQAKGQHYYSVRVGAPDTSQALVVMVSLDAYDLGQRAFPLVPGGNLCFRQMVNDIFRSAAPRFACQFPVADESLARKLEATRAANLFLPVEGRVFVAVTGAAPFHSGVPVVALHAQLRVVDPKDPTVHAEANL